ncbi:diphosphomevalonate decarboxylase [Listeria fleischmannii]|uniref:diphosphomevalonate decarboxylase n=1 Tax=Listeria fleischmannii TaxID=1069827 RepID=A0A841YD23_9LIST|nr:diphosphomevalonate decarboxylase [Listeria fleischmannii]EIA19629.1 diphosphomevalonate decarboxylase [Listeria fleischmannii subsp. coloradonensis]MBC1398109.1 diphosphomevalonate decarboxylase [Listeria fleischmannii]MBC1426170.1 diphosphomevalonate decarboxylase [Listeria fleischmannii]STY34447.1 Mevalonate pyrophosphate decarboxylase [Listeria fleischmannii subsp. coloradonensis]
MKATAIAHTNIALIKYWGKRDENLILPANSSLSITLDKFYTETSVEWMEDAKNDLFSLNGQIKQDAKVAQFLKILRAELDIPYFAKIDSVNHVPTAAGLASSASAFAALAVAGSAALGRQDDLANLSRLARRGSGSAARSLFGGLSIWEKGSRLDGLDSYAVPFNSPLTEKMAVVVAVVSDAEKAVSSRDGMKSTVLTSPFFHDWIQTAEEDLRNIKSAFLSGKFVEVGEILEHNAMKMHATTLGAKPPFTYFSPASLTVMDEVRKLRDEGIPAYFTIDAGPNVKIICLRENEKMVASRMEKLVKDVYICHAGEGAKVIQVD